MKNKRIRFTTTTFCLLAMLSSCTPPLHTFSEVNKSSIDSKKLNTVITGTIDFSELYPNIAKRNGLVNFSTKAIMSDVRNRATVSLLYPPDHSTNPNETVATGLSNNIGQFNINPDVSFSPSAGDIYILEATRRIGNAGDDQMSVRTYMRWTGTTWESITNPGVKINKETTAITIIDTHENSITASDTINSVINGTTSAIGGITTNIINQVSVMVENIISNDGDPTRFIVYKNNKYYIDREVSVNKNYLISDKYAPNSDLRNEDLSGKDLSNADLTNANLLNVILSGTNITSADFTGATWRSGGICQSGSIGNCILSDNLINTYTTNQQSFPSMAVDSEGNFVVSWQSNGQDGDNFGIYAQRYSNDGLAQGSEFKVNTYTTGAQSNPAVAMNNDGDFVISWQSNGQDGSSLGIYAQRYTSTGAVNGAEFKVSTYTTGAQSNPAVAMDNDGDFVISWQSNGQDGDNLGIYAQRYNKTGSVNGAEFKVNSHTTNIQNNPAVAMDSDGDFVVVWRSYLQDGSESSIYAQRYNQTGSMIGSEFRVNTYSTNAQRFPSVAMDSDGDFVISWHSSGQDGDNWGVYAQRYNNDGSTQGSEFQVNTYTTNQQLLPTIAMDIDGDFVISWHSTGQDGDNWGVYAQRYNNDGLAQGSEFKVNTYTTNQQLLPTIAMDSDGDFVISWYSTGQDGDTDGIYSQRYDKSGLTK